MQLELVGVSVMLLSSVFETSSWKICYWLSWLINFIILLVISRRMPNAIGCPWQHAAVAVFLTTLTNDYHSISPNATKRLQSK